LERNRGDQVSVALIGIAAARPNIDCSNSTMPTLPPVIPPMVEAPRLAHRRVWPGFIFTFLLLVSAAGLIGQLAISFFAPVIPRFSGGIRWVSVLYAIPQALTDFVLIAICWWLAVSQWQWRRDLWPILLGLVQIVCEFAIFFARQGMQIPEFAIFRLFNVTSVLFAVWLLLWLGGMFWGLRVTEPNRRWEQRKLSISTLMLLALCVAVLVGLCQFLGMFMSEAAGRSSFDLSFWLTQLAWSLMSATGLMLLTIAWSKSKYLLAPIAAVGWAILQTALSLGVTYLLLEWSRSGMLSTEVISARVLHSLIVSGLLLAMFAVVEYCGYKIAWGRQPV
jgi:hypothetical protein